MTGDRMLVAGEVEPAEATRHVQVAFGGAPGTRTFLRRQRVAYPFHLCRALYLPGDPPEFCTVYIQSCSGGIFQGDRLGMSLAAGADACAHVTTAASTIVHSMESDHAEQHVSIRADARAIVEYLPDPLILFPRARLSNVLSIVADPSATVIACDSFLAHDPRGADEPFAALRAETRLETMTGETIALDRFEVSGEEIGARQVGIHGPYTMQASLWVVHAHAPDEVLAALRSVLPDAGSVYAGASLLPGGCGAWMRALSSDSVALRRLVRDAWAAARRVVTGSAPGPRRK
ncbi:MAG: urease accessory protein UreD [Betaproteobacteria bacterium]|nr:urease accessory protein UreD [Betaproteobacteria bacterium]